MTTPIKLVTAPSVVLQRATIVAARDMSAANARSLRRRSPATVAAKPATSLVTAKTPVLVELQQLGELVVAQVYILVDIPVEEEAKNVTNAERLDTLRVTVTKLVDLADTRVAVIKAEVVMAVATEVAGVKLRLATLVVAMATCPAIAPKDKSVTIAAKSVT